jgi:hypothetical protein
MCLSCGCGEPNERHGDDRHITQDDVDNAAKAANISSSEAARNIATGAQQGGMNQGSGMQQSQPSAD